MKSTIFAIFTAFVLTASVSGDRLDGVESQVGATLDQQAGYLWNIEVPEPNVGYLWNIELPELNVGYLWNIEAPVPNVGYLWNILMPEPSVGYLWNI